jgi:hypothetical protein
MEFFVERWFRDDEGPALDVWFVEDLGVFEVREGSMVVFRSERMSDVLRFCMRDEPPELRPSEGIDPSPWEPEPEPRGR